MKWIPFVIGVAAVGGGLGACAGDPEPTDSPITVATGEECPHTPFWARDQGRAELNRRIKQFTGGRDEVPEYNDCQRFIAGSKEGPDYGALAAIYISDSIATRTSRKSLEAAAAALVWADSAYPALGIADSGFYCLMMKPLNDSGAQWDASMVRVPDGDCSRAEISQPERLVVKPRGSLPNGNSIAPGDVPGTVRWAFDTRPEGWVQYVVLPCEIDGRMRICNVGGDPSFTPLPTPAILREISPQLLATGRVRQVDMWNDVQYLAHPGPSAGGNPLPARPLLMGAIIPDKDLAERTAEDFEREWVPVAEVALSGPGYESKLNLAPTAGKEYNQIHACYYEGIGPGNCKGLPTGMEARCKVVDGVEKWRTRHTDPSGRVEYYCVQPTAYPPGVHSVPGTARWKWMSDDELAWFRCPLGCCKVIP